MRHGWSASSSSARFEVAMAAKRASPDAVSTRPLLDKLGVKPRSKVDLVFMGADDAADLERLREVKEWIEPNGAIWVVRLKGGRGALRDTDLIDAGLKAGLVDNKIASFSDTHGAMRFVFRLRDRPK